MRRFMVTVVATLLLASCNEPKVEVEPEAYRQYAEQWCTDYYQLLAECGGPSSDLATYIEGCVGRQDWDWADSCGAKMWEGRQCLISHECAIVPWNPDHQAQCERDAQGACIHPCQQHFAAVLACPRGEDENGLPYGVL